MRRFAPQPEPASLKAAVDVNAGSNYTREQLPMNSPTATPARTAPNGSSPIQASNALNNPLGTYS